jgi:hypothetical protein
MLAHTARRAALVAAISLAARAAAAQTAPAQAAGPDLRTLSLRSLKAGRTIRVGGRDFGTLTGSFVGVRDGSLWLGVEPSSRGVPVAGVDSVWVSRGHSTTGAIVGALVGVIVGAAAMSGRYCEFGDEGCITGRMAGFTGIILGSSLLGAVIGDGVKSWNLRYP